MADVSISKETLLRSILEGACAELGMSVPDGMVYQGRNAEGKACASYFGNKFGAMRVEMILRHLDEHGDY